MFHSTNYFSLFKIMCQKRIRPVSSGKDSDCKENAIFCYDSNVPVGHGMSDVTIHIPDAFCDGSGYMYSYEREEHVKLQCRELYCYRSVPLRECKVYLRDKFDGDIKAMFWLLYDHFMMEHDFHVQGKSWDWLEAKNEEFCRFLAGCDVSEFENSPWEEL